MDFTSHTYHSPTNVDQYMKINKPKVSRTSCPAGGAANQEPVFGRGGGGAGGVCAEGVGGVRSRTSVWKNKVS